MDIFERKQELLDDNFKSLRVIHGIGYQLHQLAESFGRTGNQTLEEELSDLSRDLQNLSDKIRANIGEETNLGLKQSQEDMGNILSAAVSGIKPEKQTAPVDRK